MARAHSHLSVFWQKIQYFKFEYFGGCHYLGPCDEDTFFAFAEMINLRGLFWDRGHAWYMCVTRHEGEYTENSVRSLSGFPALDTRVD